MGNLKTFTNPHMLFNSILCHLSPFIPFDRKYIELRWNALNMGYKLDLDNPKTFNEKLNWLKLYDRKPVYSSMADKYEAKGYVRERIGEEYVVPCYGVWDDVNSIDFDALPNQFVVKCTHDSGSRIICKDKSLFDVASARKKLSAALKRTYFYKSREWIYKGIKPRIIAEKYLDDKTGEELRDYKFWCFNGKPIYMYCTIKGKNIYENFYDMNFNPVDINHGFPRHKPEFEMPRNFELMKQLGGVISKDIPFVRVDFFEVDGHVYFGEFTFYDWGGFRPFINYETDLNLGNLITLP